MKNIFVLFLVIATVSLFTSSLSRYDKAVDIVTAIGEGNCKMVCYAGDKSGTCYVFVLSEDVDR